MDGFWRSFRHANNVRVRNLHLHRFLSASGRELLVDDDRFAIVGCQRPRTRQVEVTRSVVNLDAPAHQIAVLLHAS